MKIGINYNFPQSYLYSEKPSTTLKTQKNTQKPQCVSLHNRQKLDVKA